MVYTISDKRIFYLSMYKTFFFYFFLTKTKITNLQIYKKKKKEIERSRRKIMNKHISWWNH